MEMRRVIKQLLESDYSAYEISKGSGVGASIIQNFRLGKRKLDNLSLKNAEKLYEYAIAIKKRGG